MRYIVVVLLFIAPIALAEMPGVNDEASPAMMRAAKDRARARQLELCKTETERERLRAAFAEEDTRDRQMVEQMKLDHALQQQKHQLDAQMKTREDARKADEYARKVAEQQRLVADADYENRISETLGAAREYRDGKHYEKARKAYQELAAIARGRKEAATAEVELAEMLKTPGAQSFLRQEEFDKQDAAAAKKIEQAEKWLKLGDQANQNKSYDGAKMFYQKIVDAKVGGDVEMQAKSRIQALEAKVAADEK
jgi:hypothetical protein